MAVIIETLCSEDLELGINPTTKTHPSGGTLNGTQISLSTFSLAGASGAAPAKLWTPGVITAGGIATTTIDADGASFGDKVLASLTSIGDIALSISAHVNVANQVRVVLTNLTGATQTIAEGTLSVLVFRHRTSTPA